MSRTTSSAIPRSTVATMAATRRNVLRGIGLSGLAVGGASLLAACGGDSGSGSGGGSTVKFGINETADAAHQRLVAIAKAY